MRKKLGSMAAAILVTGAFLPVMAMEGEGSGFENLQMRESASVSTGLVSQGLLTLPQRTTVMDRYAGGRLKSVWNPLMNLDGRDWWLRSLKDWHSYGDGAVKGRSNSIAAGMDRDSGRETRIGFYGMYNYRKLSGSDSCALQQDWRAGVYTGKEHGPVRKYAYLDYGMLGTHYTGDLSGREGKYKGRILEIGGECQYDLSSGKDGLHVAPYVNVQLSRYWQDGYREEGGLEIASFHNTYGAGELGVELRRRFEKASYEMRAGYKRVFTGASPELIYRLHGIEGREESMMDKDYFHLTLGGTVKLKENISVSGEAGWLEGAHDRDLMADVKLNWTF